MIGNRVTEKDLRDWFSERGFCGCSARFEELELHAIQRPGWLQIYRFTALVADAEGQRALFYGAAKDDERFKLFEVKIFREVEGQRECLSRWSAGLIVQRRYRQV